MTGVRRLIPSGNVAFLLNNALLAGLIAECVYFASRSSTFLTVGNVRNIAINSSILAVVVVASTMLVVAGHIDLSIGSTIGLCGVLASLAALNWHFGAAAAIVIGIAAGAGVGAVNGVMCSYLRFSPIIVTLGMLGAIRGTTLLITVDPLYGLGGVFNTLGDAEIVGFPVIVLIALGVFLLGGVFLALTPWGRYVYAIGVNPQAAFLSGLPTRALPFFLYVATGASAGLAGVLFAARLGGAAPADLGIGMELTALTAILLGGVAFAGGRGSLFGVFVAVAFLGALQDGLVLLNVQPFVQQLAQGLVLVAAAALDAAALYLSARSDRRRQIEQRPLNSGAGEALAGQADLTSRAATSTENARSRTGLTEGDI
jgi:ribose/xylose/arabinose/galactoside ABC-type transport system permease subunit